MFVSDFDYRLPPQLIAQTPAVPRDHSRLMVVDRKLQTFTHDYFYNLPNYLRPDDLLVFNDSKVIPSRLFGKKESGGKVEILLLQNNHFIGRNIGKTSKIYFGDGLVGEIHDDVIKFNKSWPEVLKQGHVPLPPYIHAGDEQKENYQTVYAKYDGSAAAPTAGFHFTPELLAKIPHKQFVTLHVGLGTFAPVKTENIEEHHMHSEYFMMPKNFDIKGKKVVAVGTTSARALESDWGKHETSIFIYPGYKFKHVDALITNFHLPKSTLLMLVCAFASRELIMRAYHEAIRLKYRFYSFGDAMLII